MSDRDYMISFNGHLKEETRPEGWPKVVYDKAVFRVHHIEQELVDYMNAKVTGFQAQQGMTVSRENIPNVDDGLDLSTEKSFGNGLFIPMHMIAFMSYTVKRLQTLVPNNDSKEVM